MDMAAADTLSTCPKLTTLTLRGNPISRTPNYAKVVATLIPTLTKLDGVAVCTLAASRASNSMILEAASHIRLMEEEMEDERRMEMEMFEGMGGFEEQNQSGYSGGGNQVRSSVNSTGKDSVNSSVDTGSELTYGSNSTVLAGSMASALRQRRSNNNPDVSTVPSQPMNPRRHVGDGGKQTDRMNSHSPKKPRTKMPADNTITGVLQSASRGVGISSTTGGGGGMGNNGTGSSYMEGDITDLYLKDMDNCDTSDDEDDIPTLKPAQTMRDRDAARARGPTGSSNMLVEDSTAGAGGARRRGSGGFIPPPGGAGSEDPAGISRSNSFGKKPPPSPVSSRRTVTSRESERVDSRESNRPGSSSRNRTDGGSRPDSGVSTGNDSVPSALTSRSNSFSRPDSSEGSLGFELSASTHVSPRPGSSGSGSNGRPGSACTNSYKGVDTSIQAPFVVQASPSASATAVATATGASASADSSDSPKASLLSLYNQPSDSLSRSNSGLSSGRSRNSSRGPKGGNDKGSGSDSDSDQDNYYYNNTRGRRKLGVGVGPAASLSAMVASEDEEDDDEDVTITHASRHEAMRNNSSTKLGGHAFARPTSSGDGGSRRPLSALAASLSQTTVSAGIANKDSPAGGTGVDADTPGRAAAGDSVADNTPPNRSTREGSGIRLFNNKMSMHNDADDNEDDEDGSGSGSDDEPIFSSNNTSGGGRKATASMLAGLSLGFDLTGSLAAIDQWVKKETTGGTSTGPDSDSEAEATLAASRRQKQKQKLVSDSTDQEKSESRSHIPKTKPVVLVGSASHLTGSSAPTTAVDNFITVGGVVNSNNSSRRASPAAGYNSGSEQKVSARERLDRLSNNSNQGSTHNTRDYLSTDILNKSGASAASGGGGGGIAAHVTTTDACEGFTIEEDQEDYENTEYSPRVKVVGPSDKDPGATKLSRPNSANRSGSRGAAATAAGAGSGAGQRPGSAQRKVPLLTRPGTGGSGGGSRPGSGKQGTPTFRDDELDCGSGVTSRSNSASTSARTRPSSNDDTTSSYRGVGTVPSQQKCPPNITGTGTTNPNAAPSLALNLTDAELVVILKDKPKNRIELRTEKSYKAFFTGMGRTHMQELLTTAYSSLVSSGGDATTPGGVTTLSAEEVEAKVTKRLRLLQEVLVDS